MSHSLYSEITIWCCNWYNIMCYAQPLLMIVNSFEWNISASNANFTPSVKFISINASKISFSSRSFAFKIPVKVQSKCSLSTQVENKKHVRYWNISSVHILHFFVLLVLTIHWLITTPSTVCEVTQCILNNKTISPSLPRTEKN